MGKGELSPIITAGDCCRRSSVLQIFREAARLFWASRKPLLSIFLLLLLPYSLLYLSNFFLVIPLNADMTTKFMIVSTTDPRSPEYYELLAAVLKDIREITGAGAAMIVVSFLSSAFLLMAAVHTIAMAAKGEQVTLRDLLCRFRRTWKGLVITKLYVAIITFGCYLILFFIGFGVTFFIFSSQASIVSLVLGSVAAVMISIMGFLLLVYLQMVWYQGLVISVVEEDCYGLAALGRASVLIRGKRGLGFWVNFLLMLMAAVVALVYYFVNTSLPAGNAANLVAGLAMNTVVVLLLALFDHAVFVVFYRECRKGQEEEVALKGNMVYTRVPTAPAVDEALP